MNIGEKEMEEMILSPITDSSGDAKVLTTLGQLNWIIDLGSTFHVSHDKSIFITYCLVKGDWIQMGNG